MIRKIISIVALFLLFASAQVYASVVFSDNFNRADNGSVGNGWTVLESTGDVDILNNQMFFNTTKNLSNRPMVYHSFTDISSGSLSWSFEFDWTRTSTEQVYGLFMQLGDSNQMSTNSQDAGIGVNLAWTNINGVHESLAYVVNNTYTALDQISGNTVIQVLADVGDKNYSVNINGFNIANGIPFDNDISSIDTVRFFTDGLLQTYFTGRTFDDVQISTVPIPSAIWFLGSGMIGLVGIRRKLK
jgi:hypothetical protein